MGLLDKEVTRRSFLGGLAAGSVLLLPGCEWRRFSIDNDIITDDNIEDAERVLRERAKEFPVLNIPVPPKVSKFSQLVTLPGLGEENEAFRNSVVRAFSIARNAEINDLLIIYIAFNTGVSFGKLFENPWGTPWPGFLFFVGEKVKGHAAAAGYRPVYEDADIEAVSLDKWRSHLTGLAITFPLRVEDMKQAQFVAHLNPGLVKVEEKNLASFTFPYRLRFVQLDNNQYKA